MMNQQRVVNDKISFDWNVVALVDPDYANEYLYDLNEQSHTDENDVFSLLEESDRQRRVEHDEDICVAPRAILPSRMGQIETDEEMDIIRQVTGCEDDGNKPIAATNAFDLRDINETYCHHKPIKCNWVLQKTYETYGSNPIPTVPLLMPPKRFLASPSELYYGTDQRDDIMPSVYDGMSNEGIGTLRTRKVAVSHDGIHVRLIHSMYYFDKVKNITSQKKGNLEFLTFNRKLGMIFRTYHEETTKSKRSRRYRRKVMSCNFSLEALGMTLSKFTDPMIRKFTDEVVMAAYEDLGDLYLPAPKNHQSTVQYCALVLNAVMWQYKARRPLPWADNTVFLENLSIIIALKYMRRCLHHMDPIRSAMLDAEKRIEMKWRKKKLAAVTKAVRNSDSSKDIIKSILGESYKGTYARMLLEMSSMPMKEFEFIPIIEVLLQNKQIPKKIYHSLSKMVKNLTTDNVTWLKCLIGSIMFWDRFTTNPNHRLYGWADKFITLNDRFVANGYAPVLWNHLRDTLDMAEQFNIRVRINKFERPMDVTRLHDRLSNFARRDARAVREAPIFLPFTHPTKEYNGFTFEHLDTAEKLVEEGTCMKHCVGGYASRCFRGESIIFAMKNGRSWVTIELDGTTKDLRINQQYTIGDNPVNNEQINNTINQWHSDVVKMHQDDQWPHQTVADTVKDIISIRRTVSWFEDNQENSIVDGEAVMHDVPVLTKKVESLFNELAEAGIPVEMVKYYVETLEQSVTETKQQRFPRQTAYDEGNAINF